MHREVELSDLGLDEDEEAVVVEWHLDEGDPVEEGDVLLEVQCESGTVEVPSPYSGVLVEKLVEEEDIVRVGEPVAVIDVREEEVIFPDEEEE